MPKTPLHTILENKLTEKDKLEAALVVIIQRLPTGREILTSMAIDESTKEIKDLFETYNLPNQEELITELQTWRTHTEQAKTYADRCTHLIQQVFEEVDTRADDGRTPSLSE